jgi:fatty acid-binding protein DegV
VNSWVNFIFYFEKLRKKYFDIYFLVISSKLSLHVHKFVFRAKVNFKSQILTDNKASMKDQ